jgi:Cof subfamily protein (haloacid dehalogenase superfamily)
MAVLDIDGTLVTKWKRVTPKTKRVIWELTQRGVPVCLCTGRNVMSALPVARTLRLTTPVVCVNGMIMYDPWQKKILYESKLPNSVMLQVLDIVKARHVYVEVLTLRHYHQYMKDKSLKGYSFNFYGLHPAPMAPLVKWMEYRFGIRHLKNLDRFYRSDEQIYQIVAIGDHGETEAVLQEIGALGNSDILTRVIWDCMVFVSARNVSKSEGMKLLCARFHADPKEVVAIGDDMNDLDMIRSAGMGVAMGNARDAVKAAADYVTKSNEEDGAALALEKFFPRE